MLNNPEESFRLLFTSNPRPVWVYDAETLAFLEVNDAAVAHYGYSREEFLQMRLTDIRPPQDVERFLQVSEDESTESRIGSEWRHLLKDGRIVDVEIASQPLTYQDRPARLVIAQDISERKATRRALASQVRHFALVADLGIKALSGISLDALFELAVSQVAAELRVELAKVLELQPGGESLLLRAGVGWQEPYRPGETFVSAGLDSQAGYTLTTSEPVVVDDLRSESRFNGPPLLIQHNVVSGVSVIIPGREEPYGVLGVHTLQRRHFEAHDIAFVQTVANTLATAIERNRADSLLRSSEERFRAVVQNAHHMVTIHDAAGTILYDSPPVQRILGYDLQERLGQNIMAYVHPDDVPVAAQKLGELIGVAAQRVAVQLRVRHQDGSWRTVEATSANMMHNQALQGIVVNWHDVTDRVTIQNEIEDLNARLEERVQLRTAQLQATNQELEAFAYTVSHDLRAPLRAMDGYARVLLEDDAIALSPDAQGYLQRIRHNAQEMDMLIQDLLSFSRLKRQPLTKKTVQPLEVVEEVLESLEMDRQGRQITVDLRPLPAAHVDRSMLKVLYVNLLSNAFKYTRTRENARIEVGAIAPQESANESAVYYVRDNGVGFDMKYATKVFGVFQRLHRVEEYEGTGVGLATVQRIVRRHGGKVWVHSQEDQGTTVYFTIEEN